MPAESTVAVGTVVVSCSEMPCWAWYLARVLIRSVSVTASASSENAAGAFDPAGHNESFALNQQGVSDAVAGAMERSGLRQAPIDNPLRVGCGGI